MRKQKRMKRTGGSGLIPQESLSQPNDNKPWTVAETEFLLNWYFGMKGALLLCARKLGRGLGCCERQIAIYHYLEEASKIMTYRPSKLRENRTGMAFNSAEQRLIECHSERRISYKITARILARKPEDLEAFEEGHSPAPLEAGVSTARLKVIVPDDFEDDSDDFEDDDSGDAPSAAYKKILEIFKRRNPVAQAAMFEEVLRELDSFLGDSELLALFGMTGDDPDEY